MWDLLGIFCLWFLLTLCYCKVSFLPCSCSTAISPESFQQFVLEVPPDLREGCQGEGALAELRKHLGGAAVISYNTSDNSIHVMVSWDAALSVLFFLWCNPVLRLLCVMVDLLYRVFSLSIWVYDVTMKACFKKYRYTAGIESGEP